MATILSGIKKNLRQSPFACAATSVRLGRQQVVQSGLFDIGEKCSTTIPRRPHATNPGAHRATNPYQQETSYVRRESYGAAIARFFTLLVHCDRRAASRGRLDRRQQQRDQMPMMAITTSSSTSVKPCRGREKRLCFSEVNGFLRPRTWRFLEWNASLNHHWCVGIDLHKDTLTACVFCGCCGEVSFQKIACKCRKQIAEYFAALPRPHTVAIESVGFYRWLWEMLEPIVEKLVLADATQARALAGRRLKTDREDAFNIAELLAAGRLPTSYAPPLEVQMLRDLTRHRNGFSRQHARVLCRVKSRS